MNTNLKREIRKIRTMFLPLGQKEPAKSTIDLNKRVLVGTHHKTGTVWMIKVFRRICQEFGLKYYSGEQQKMPKDFDVFLQNHSKFDFGKLQTEYRGLHMIRDPRDKIVSGCFYHKESKEQWLHIKRDEFGRLTYQEKINSYKSLDDQIMFEMEHSGQYGIRQMLNWNYKNPAFFEVKYEDLISDENLILFHKIFSFLEFPGKAIPQILRISYDNSLFSGSLRNSIHIRSGETRQWEKYFKPSHKARFLELFGDALIRLGYESNDDWANR